MKEKKPKLEPKQEIKAESETLNFDNPAYEFVPKGRHEWRQQGYYLICFSCDLQHAVGIGPDKIMVGVEEDGSPILKKRELLS